MSETNTALINAADTAEAGLDPYTLNHQEYNQALADKIDVFAQQWLDRFGTATVARGVIVADKTGGYGTPGNLTVGVDHEVFEDTYIEAGWEKHYNEDEVSEVKAHIVASLLGKEDPVTRDIPDNPLPLLNTVVIERGTEQPSADKPRRRILHGGIVVAAVRDFRAGTLTVPANLLPDWVGIFADGDQRLSYEDMVRKMVDDRADDPRIECGFTEDDARHGLDIDLRLAVYEI